MRRKRRFAFLRMRRHQQIPMSRRFAFSAERDRPPLAHGSPRMLDSPNMSVPPALSRPWPPVLLERVAVRLLRPPLRPPPRLLVAPRRLPPRRVPPPRWEPPRAFCLLVPPPGRLPLVRPRDLVARRFVLADLGMIHLLLRMIAAEEANRFTTDEKRRNVEHCRQRVETDFLRSNGVSNDN